MQELLKAIQEYGALPQELAASLDQYFQPISLKKKTLLVREGAYCHQFWFVEKGLFRSFFLKDGKERTYWFYQEGQFFTSWYSFYLDKPSFESIDAIEDSLLYGIEREAFEELCQEHPAFATFARHFIQGQYAQMDFITKSFTDLSAQEKYDQLMEALPNLGQRAKLGQIASLLGMSQETLSRLRARR